MIEQCIIIIKLFRDTNVDTTPYFLTYNHLEKRDVHLFETE